MAFKSVHKKYANKKYIKIGDNYWTAAKYSPKEALAMSKTLEDCDGCLDCANCVGCEDCIDCRNCTDCYDCEGCVDCTELRNRSGIKNGHGKHFE